MTAPACPPFASLAPDGVAVYIRLSPGASRNGFGGLETVQTPHGKPRVALRAAVTAAPEDGKANAALIALLAKTLRLPKSAITLTRGQTDRTKTLHIAAADARALLDALSRLAG